MRNQFPDTLKKDEPRKNQGQGQGQGQQDKDQGIAGTAQKAGTAAMETAQNFGTQVKDSVMGAAESVASTSRDVAHNVGQRSDDATAAVGSSLKTAASSIRDYAPSSGMGHSAADSVARTLEAGGDYLEHEKLSGAMRDVTDTIRRYPVAAVCVGFGLGFLIARSCASTREY
ncbi:MAG: hypothetical protein WD872_11690 [Pirellulaceae bacterium]